MPTAPPAPVRFTTTTGCFSAFSICEASGRPTISATPPGGNGTIIVTGLDGYASWAATGIARNDSNRSTSRDIGLLLRNRGLQDVTDLALYRFTCSPQAREM